MRSSYLPLSRGSSDGDYDPTLHLARPRWSLSWKDIALVILVASNIALAVALSFSSFSSNICPEEAYPQSSYTGIHAYPDKWQPATWWSMYSAKQENETASADAAWEAMVPAHGIVAMDKQWAEERQLPLSMELPSDHSKQVYILEAYHMLHCLSIMRKSFYQVLRNETTSYPTAHAGHCFDAIRQHVMCVADDTPLYTWGQNVAGDGQLRKCRNWDVLRNWAKENTACYADNENAEGGQFYKCDNGTDGLVLVK